ncbi:ABC transporter B family member 26, chloroplastic [Morella rubra]|uniref:ABC transporter B family member 26, chloroplastic n=1 Tax=Morella rubra TaxID=262757 RepID=A0A6A1V8E2_9ROSI|nr:ABC transporter B family member 26, chloroplastic [Morella rubra]
MAIFHSNLPSLATLSFPPSKPFTIANPKTPTKPRSAFPITSRGIKTKCQCFDIRNPLIPDPKNDEGKDKVLENSVGFVRSLWPGGSWWGLSVDDNAEIAAAKPVTVIFALRRMWELIADDRWVVIVAFGALVIAALSEISVPGVLAASIFSAQSGDSVVFSRNSQFLVILCFTSGICSGLRSGCFGIANMILVTRLRESLYSAIVFQDIPFFDREAVGDLTSRLGADCQQLSNVIRNNVHLILRNAVQGTGALVNLLTLSWPLALSTLVICSVLSIIFLFYGQYQRRAAKLTQEFTAGANEVAQETLSVIRTVQAMAGQVSFCKHSRKCGLWIVEYEFQYLIPVNTVIRNGMMHKTKVIALLLGGMSIMCGHVSAEQLTKYILYWLKLQRVMGQIQFVNVSFHYPSRSTVPILEDMHISVEANEVVAIVGLSGSGKSTIVNLLLRYYEPSNGQIYLDGFSLRELDIRWLREKVGFVGQEPHLFRMDIKSNIRYGCSRHCEQPDIEWAAKQAFAHEFISSLPDGYDTLVDDNLLSRGQKQRIAIARAILRDPAILILDEATSALDSESEHYVKANNLHYGDKLFNRFSTIKAADRIVVLDAGRVIEQAVDTNDKEAMDLQEKAADEVVEEPPVLEETGKGKNMEQRNGDKVAKEREGPKGLPYHQVPQPLVDFSSEALEQL